MSVPPLGLKMISLVLINPNTNPSTTAMMVDIARGESGERARIEGMTAPFGVPLITHEAALLQAGLAVEALAPALKRSRAAGVIVSAFGDPGLHALRELIDGPVTGIAEASMAEAAFDELGRPRRFSVVTTTPLLEESITARAASYGLAKAFAGVRLTPGDPAQLMADPEAVTEALARACESAIERDGAEAIVIGGGPLAMAARALRPRFVVPIIEPIPAAVRLAIKRSETPARRD